ncbi:MAG TPA: hypothetical protein VNE59_11135 [Burkholderiales bacterium]|nr:hypothetical protein [Burkholderiales bacterium]
MLRLNLGCGANRMAGWVNVDREASLAPDQVVDLERFPWPWPDDSADEVLLNHVLEHLGATPAGFIGVMKELWRVCRGGARIQVNVPDPRHDDFLGDPTHVRPVTLDTLGLFSQRFNREALAAGGPNTPLGLIHGVNFEVEEHERVLDEPWRARCAAGELDGEALERALRHYVNVVREHRFRLVALKPGEAGA